MFFGRSVAACATAIKARPEGQGDMKTTSTLMTLVLSVFLSANKVLSQESASRIPGAVQGENGVQLSNSGGLRGPGGRTLDRATPPPTHHFAARPTQSQDLSAGASKRCVMPGWAVPAREIITDSGIRATERLGPPD